MPARATPRRDSLGLDAHLVRVSALAARDAAAIPSAVTAALDAGVAVDDLHEALLQSYLFLGYPRAINALTGLRRALDARGLALPGRGPGHDSIGLWRRRGERLCRRIYGASFEKMLRNMRALSPELAAWILWEGYGKVLSRPRLDARRRELCVLAILAVEGTIPQLQAHLRGAVNVGATAADLTAVRTLIARWLPRRHRRPVDAAFAAAGAAS
ncbi:MAG: carboxymuconolactone decarboxylase family protein [Planctomycetes bacterium]|nr:carboxymuconolactone decarboxylase family protein [Planctomycetota bacterium]